jgi:hypothetical protein
MVCDMCRDTNPLKYKKNITKSQLVTYKPKKKTEVKLAEKRILTIPIHRKTKSIYKTKNIIIKQALKLNVQMKSLFKNTTKIRTTNI